MKICAKCKEEKDEICFSPSELKCNASRCKICLKKYLANYYKNNKEIILSNQKSYYEDNKEFILEKNKIYYENNKEEILIQNKIYIAEHKDEITIYKKNIIKKTKMKF